MNKKTHGLIEAKKQFKHDLNEDLDFKIHKERSFNPKKKINFGVIHVLRHDYTLNFGVSSERLVCQHLNH